MTDSGGQLLPGVEVATLLCEGAISTELVPDRTQSKAAEKTHS
ncbi:hypothetical protein [Ornithinimicrobium sp. INDO-MA30-4]|nr:hypothetical protein [Ornithinimicrobium sp. INDO-MA30-4]